ncbi:hypothetical protein HN747_03320 [archaeon]|jgi:hypothetical protein|nr:hypothetical protein [archaeon]
MEDRIIYLNEQMDDQARLISTRLSKRLEEPYNPKLFGDNHIARATEGGHEGFYKVASVYRGFLKENATKSDKTIIPEYLRKESLINLELIYNRALNLGAKLAEVKLEEDPGLIHVIDKNLVRWRIVSGKREQKIVDSFRFGLGKNLGDIAARGIMELTAETQVKYIEERRKAEYKKRGIPTETGGWGYNIKTGSEIYLKSVPPERRMYCKIYNIWSNDAKGWSG